MMSTDRLKGQAIVSRHGGWVGRSEGACALATKVAIAWLPVAAVLGCRGEPAEVRTAEPESEPAIAAPTEHPVSALIDLGSDEGPRHVMEGFSLPERVGARFASWSEGELSTVTVNLRGGAGDYLVAFLAEPYHRLGEVAVNVALNGKPIGEAQLARGWRAYQLPVSGERVMPGRNTLSFQYSKTARPSDLDPASSDVRALSVRFDQIQIAPVSDRIELGFGSKNALAQAALAEGWARDPGDRGTGTWTVAERAQLTFRLSSAEAAALPVVYELALTARAPQGVAERSVALTLNGAALGELRFGATKTTARLAVPSERLGSTNVLGFEFTGLASPAELDAASKDKRLLGLRVFELVVGPLQAPAPALPAPQRPGKEPVAEAPR